MSKRKVSDAQRRLRQQLLERPLSRYRRLSDRDVADALDVVRSNKHWPSGRSIDDVPISQLKDAINDIVSLTDWWRDQDAKHPPNLLIERLQKAEGTLDAALDALTARDLVGVARGLDRLAAREPFTLDVLPGFAPMHQMLHGIVMPTTPSLASIRQVGEACDAIRVLAKAVRARIEIVQGHQGSLRTKTAPHQADWRRYALIIHLASIYKRFFGLPPNTTRGGPFCAFLTEVLSRCDKDISEDRVYAIWLDARTGA
jgi:hypothetical protein